MIRVLAFYLLLAFGCAVVCSVGWTMVHPHTSKHHHHRLCNTGPCRPSPG